MITRRNLLQTSAILAAAAPLAGAFDSHAFAASEELRLYWWGSQDRARRTLEVASLFGKANPDIVASGEPVGSDYWPKLATMMVGGNLPDIIQMEANSLPDYSRRGANLPLNDYLGKAIRTDRLAEGVLKLGTIDEKVTGIALGLNAFSLFYDKEAFTKAGIEGPKWGTTWEEIGKIAIEVAKASGKSNYWGIANGARYNYVFDAWLHQRDKTLFTEDGKFGFDVEDAKAWYAYWDKLAKAGATVAADVQSGDTHLIDTNPLTKGATAMAFTFSNQFVGYQTVLKQPLGIATLPVESQNGKSGLFYRPALTWSIGKTSKHADAAAKFIDFFINSPEAGKILGVERGVPINLDVRAAVAPTLNDNERASVAYIDFIADKVGAYPAPPPLGSTEFDVSVMRPIADQLAFGKLSVDDAAKKLIADGKRVMRM